MFGLAITNKGILSECVGLLKTRRHLFQPYLLIGGMEQGKKKDIFCTIWFPLVVCIDKRKGRDNILYNFIKINLYLKKNAKYMEE